MSNVLGTVRVSWLPKHVRKQVPFLYKAVLVVQKWGPVSGTCFGMYG